MLDLETRNEILKVAEAAAVKVAAKLAKECGDLRRPEPPPLMTNTAATVDTATAAYYLDRKPQTLREWAMTGHPIRPRRVNGRLAWPLDKIKELLGVEHA